MSNLDVIEDARKSCVAIAKLAQAVAIGHVSRPDGTLEMCGHLANAVLSLADAVESLERRTHG